VRKKYWYDPLAAVAHDPAANFDYLKESVHQQALYFMNVPYSHVDPFVAKLCDDLI
jgi:hypothetical protein